MIVLFLAACTPAGVSPTAEPAATRTVEPPMNTAIQASTPSVTPSIPPGQVFSGEAEIEIEDFSFTPEEITITAGTTVKWSNKDDSAHTVAGDDGSWGSPRLSKGDEFMFTFNEPGTYTYHCAIHPSMTGTIVVIAP
jgi:plastocyanin